MFCMITLAITLGCSTNAYQYQFSEPSTSHECVVVLHGLRGTSSTFNTLSERLQNEGYGVLLVDYPSTQYDIQTLADSIFPQAIRCCEPHCHSLHIVAHSMGAILVRYYLQEHPMDKLGRVVMLSPPNHGIALIDRFRGCSLFRTFNGPGGMQLGANKDSFVNSLTAPDYQVGILMSTCSINWLASLFIPGKDDGRVSLSSARLSGMQDFKLIPTNHHVIMKKQETIDEVVQFLKQGKFSDR